VRFVILCPDAVRTGGPEACYQLSDALIRHKFTAEVWLVNQADINFFKDGLTKGLRLSQNRISLPERFNNFEEYKNYLSKPFRSYSPGEEIIFILPEVYIWALPIFIGLRVVIWWLSVDNSFGALSRVNANLLRLPLVKHAVQSEYARVFTRSLGLESVLLTDYTVVPEVKTMPLENRPSKVAVNAGKKVIFDLSVFSNLLRSHHPSLEVVHVVGLSRHEIYSLFSESRVFVDLGNFPGKDRMAREALLLGANVVISGTGAGHYEQDFSIPDKYRPDPYNINYVSELVAGICLDPKSYWHEFEQARNIISRERQVFFDEVLQFANTKIFN
jgi:hypothetical protein